MYLKIGKKTISEKNKPFVIAEIGVNHNGRYSIAKKLIDKAISCGAKNAKQLVFKSLDEERRIRKEMDAAARVQSAAQRAYYSTSVSESLRIARRGHDTIAIAAL